MDLLSQIGGLMKIVLAAAVFINQIYGYFLAKLRIIESIFRVRNQALAIKRTSFQQEMTEETCTALKVYLQTHKIKSNCCYLIHFLLTFVLCCSKIKKSQQDRYVERARKKLRTSMDIVTLVRTQKRLKAIEHVLFNKSQRILNKMNRWNFLSENSSTSSDGEYPDVFRLNNYRLVSKIDVKLLENAYPSTISEVHPQKI